MFGLNKMSDSGAAKVRDQGIISFEIRKIEALCFQLYSLDQNRIQQNYQFKQGVIYWF